MPKQHKAYATLHGKQVNGWKVQVSQTSEYFVRGELVCASRTALLFIIEAQEGKFDDRAVQDDIQREFAEYIRRQNLAPPGPVRLKLTY